MLSCSLSLLEFAHRQPAGSANSHSRRQTRKNAAFAGGRTPVKAGLYSGCSDPKRKLAQGTTNHLYSVSAVTNLAGQVVERYSYNAYGVRTVKNPAGVTIAKSAVNSDRGFTSYKLDAETGLYYARNRSYSARSGRFISRDNYTQSDSGPLAEDGYYNGMSLYMGYFVPNGVDPSGQYTSPYGLTDCVLHSSEWIDEPSVGVDVKGFMKPVDGNFDPTISWAGVKYFKMVVLLDVNIRFNVNCEYWCKGKCSDGSVYPDYAYDGDEIRGPGILISDLRVTVRLPAAPWPIPASWKWIKLVTATMAAGSTADMLNEVANAAKNGVSVFKTIVHNYGPTRICQDQSNLIRLLEQAAKTVGEQGMD